MRRTCARAVPAALFLAAIALAGCGAPATFVSVTPPPDLDADAWYGSSLPAVRTALRRAMVETGLTLGDDAGEATVVGLRQQVPYVGEGAGDPVPGRLPVYRLTARLSSEGGTRVRVHVSVVCDVCDGATPYEWEYPGDIVRNVFERTRRMLGERHARYACPERYRPPRWRPPVAR